MYRPDRKHIILACVPSMLIFVLLPSQRSGTCVLGGERFGLGRNLLISWLMSYCGLNKKFAYMCMCVDIDYGTAHYETSVVAVTRHETQCQSKDIFVLAVEVLLRWMTRNLHWSRL